MSNFSAPDHRKISHFSPTRNGLGRVRMRGMRHGVGEEKGRGRRVIGEWRWPRSLRFPPTRPDRIKLLEDGRKYRGSTRSCRSRGETTRAWGGIGEGERGQDENESRDDRTSGQPQGTRGEEGEERGVPATPRNAVLQLLRSSCCVNVLIHPAWARPIRDTA